MATMRHWKQHFCADAEFVYRKRLNLGGGEWSSKGSPVDKAALGPKKLRRFWDSNVIEIANWRPLNVIQRDEPAVEPRGQGWYFIHWRGITHRARGQGEVDALVARLIAESKAA